MVAMCKLVPEILFVSRSTDISVFYDNWFMAGAERLVRV